MLKYKYSLLYCLATAISSSCIDGVTDYMPTAYVLCISCLVAIIYFNIASSAKLIHIYKTIYQHKKSFLIINILVAIMWACTFFGIAIGGATYYLLIYFSIGGLAAMIFMDFKSNKLQIILLIFLTALTYFVKSNIIGFILGLTGGLTGFLYLKLSKDLHDNLGFSSNEVLAIRFWLLFIILLLVTPNKDFIIYTNMTNILTIIFVAFLSMIVQLWFSQQGIVYSGVRIHQYIVSLTPSATFFAQGAILGEWHPVLLLLTLIIPVVLFSDTIFKTKRNN